MTGKVNFDTSKGVGVDYNGGVAYEDGPIKVDILKLGAKFRAAAEKLVGNHTEHALNYQGAFDVEQGGRTVHVATNGVAKFQGEVEVDQDKHRVLYRKKLTNQNDWNLTHDEYVVTGNKTAHLGVDGIVDYKGNHVTHRQHIEGRAEVDGNAAFANGTDIGNFSVSKVVQALIKKEIDWNPNPKEHEPNFTFHGGAVFNKKGGSRWNNETSGYSYKGQAKFRGRGWAKHNEVQPDNSTLSGIGFEKDVAYQYRGIWGKEGKLLGEEAAAGQAKIARGFKHHNYNNGTHEFTNVVNGQLKQKYKGALKNETNAKRINYYQDKAALKAGIADDYSKGEFEDYYNKKIVKKGHLPKLSVKTGKVVKGHLDATWRGGSSTAATANQDGTVGVTNNGGAAWGVKGTDNIHGDWEHQGNRTVSANFVLNNGTQEVKDINVSFGNEEDFLSKILNAADKFQKFVDKFRN